MKTNSDVSSIEAKIGLVATNFFNAVSFKEGDKPAYHALRQIFIESAPIIRNSSPIPEISTVDQFIAPRQRMVDSGELTSFKEAETAQITESFGNIAHRFSTYEKCGIREGKAFEGRGIIS